MHDCLFQDKFTFKIDCVKGQQMKFRKGDMVCVLCHMTALSQPKM